jgi:membrane protease YdiL (CAAX protease family)
LIRPASRSDLRLGVLLATIAALLVASENVRWGAATPWLEPRMLFGLVAPLLLGAILTDRTYRLGLGFGTPRRGLLVLALGLPATVGAMLVLIQASEVEVFYRGHGDAPLQLALAYLPAILQVEVCFRGVLLFGLLPRLGAVLAISVSVLPYGLVHLDKPLEEALGSIVVGIALAAAAIWCRSIWYGLILHLFGAVVLTLLARG